MYERQEFKPKDPRYRGGLRARVVRGNRKASVVVYMCGGQRVSEDMASFLDRYELVCPRGKAKEVTGAPLLEVANG